MRGVLVLSVLVGFSAIALVSVSAAAEGIASGGERNGNARARELFRLGTNAYKAGRVEEARQLLDEAWALQQSYDVAATLGQVELELGRVVRANELLDICIETFPPIESDDKLAKMQAMRERARQSVAELSVRCDCPEAELLVDGEFVGTMPLKRALYVLPGSHSVSLRQGETAARVLVEVAAGQRYPIELRLGEPPSRQPAPISEAKHSIKRPSVSTNVAPPTWPIYAGLGVSALGVAAAVGFKVASNDASNRAAALRDKLSSSSVCRETTSASGLQNSICGQLSDAVSEERDYARFAWYSIGGAAAATGATVVYWIWRAGEAPRVDKARALRRPFVWAMTLAPNTVTLTGAF